MIHGDYSFLHTGSIFFSHKDCFNLNQLALENYCVNHFHLLFCLKHIKKANKKTQEVFLKATALPQSKLYFVTTVFLKKERPSAIYTKVSLLLKTITVIVLYNKITN